ncbi:hypothetical protein [Enterococcus sp. UD-01]|jgi:hypothetical protein|uniref:hypothetical protein n=1 Tax=Enterococcus sp. UD-01 TaxID=3373911 RepID=UPI003837D12C
MEKIASSISAANSAVVGVNAVVISKGQQVTLEKSTIASIEIGVEVNNQLLSDLSQFIHCVQEQSNKFPEIAELMAFKDSQFQFKGCE